MQCRAKEAERALDWPGARHLTSHGLRSSWTDGPSLEATPGHSPLPGLRKFFSNTLLHRGPRSRAQLTASRLLFLLEESFFVIGQEVVLKVSKN